MSLVLRSVRVLDVQSEWNNQIIDLFVSDQGIIERFDNQKFKKEINLENASVFPGILDMAVNFGEPGLEHKETISSGCKAAMAGGVTSVLHVPNVDPIIDSKETISYLKAKSRDEFVDIYLQAGASKKLQCKALTEMLDMVDNGADAFGDGYSNIWHGGLLLKALQYLQHTDKVLINSPYDAHLMGHGLVHEGKVSTRNGLSGIPSLVEHIAVARDLEILKYSGGRLHFAQISCAESVDMIKHAKKQGLNVTCGVNYFNLIANENAIEDFDTNNKVFPPLRTETDRKALIKAVKDGIVDVIVSDHRPQEEDCKKLEFNYAEFGKIGVQTMFIALKSFTDLTYEELQKALVLNPKKILNKEFDSIKEGAKANFFVFSNEQHVLTSKDLHSISKNTSEIGQKFKYKIHTTVKGSKYLSFGN